MPTVSCAACLPSNFWLSKAMVAVPTVSCAACLPSNFWLSNAIVAVPTESWAADLPSNFWLSRAKVAVPTVSSEGSFPSNLSASSPVPEPSLLASQTESPALFIVPVTAKLPTTLSFSPGLVVPIPTLPWTNRLPIPGSTSHQSPVVIPLEKLARYAK